MRALAVALVLSLPGWSGEGDALGTLAQTLVPLDSVAPREPPTERDPSPRGQRKTPKLRLGTVEVSGGVDVETVRRILHRSFGRFRLCYEAGLKRQPELQGPVSIRFLIERNGTSSNARNEGSVFPDAEVISCMAGAVNGLSFPRPEGGTASVLIRVWLDPPS